LSVKPVCWCARQADNEVVATFFISKQKCVTSVNKDRGLSATGRSPTYR
jgi:hypothetical protein